MNFKTLKLISPTFQYPALFFSQESPIDETHLNLLKTQAMLKIEKYGNCSFFMQGDSKYLVKVEERKYSPKKSPIQWFFKDIIRSRLVGYNRSRIEYNSNQKLKSLGFNVLDSQGWGVSLNPFSKEISFLSLEFLSDSMNLREVVNETNYNEIISEWVAQMIKLGQMGYYMQDAHAGNFLYYHDKIYFIDTEVKKLPTNQKRRKNKVMKFHHHILKTTAKNKQQLADQFVTSLL